MYDDDEQKKKEEIKVGKGQQKRLNLIIYWPFACIRWFRHCSVAENFKKSGREPFTKIFRDDVSFTGHLNLTWAGIV